MVPLRPALTRLAALVVLLGPAADGVASASQYALDQAAAIIPPTEAQKLRRAGVRTTADFLTWGRTAEGRRLLAERAGVSLAQVTTWVRLADLMRVPGIGPDVARLLTAAQVRSVAELRAADAEATAAAIHAANRRDHLSQNPPGAASIAYWVQLAASLPILIVLD